MKTTIRVMGAFAFAAGLLTSAMSQAATFANGADVGWVTQQESSNYGWYNSSGVKTDPFVLLKNGNINAVRLRVWVNPSGGWCDGKDVLYKAQRAKAQGQRIMIDFHYSDTWADPGHQTKPAAWSSHTIGQLYTDVYNHTTGILNYLKSNGIAVDWVQVGNEINGGMLWPEGSTSNFSQLAQLINSGYNGVKAVYPNAPVIVHVANGYDGAKVQWFFDSLKSNGGKFDMVGLSHYPPANNWSSYNNQLDQTMHNIVNRYNKPVVISEVGMDWTQAATAKAMVSDVITKVKFLGSYGAGVFYWEPEAYPGWQGYTMGATDSGGKFTAAMDAFR